MIFTDLLQVITETLHIGIMSTRDDDIVRNAWSSALDPRISPMDKARGITSHSKLIIEACRPFSWADKFPPASALTPAEAREIEMKWGAALKG